MFKTRFTELVGIQWPIIQAPMIGGYSSPEMVAIVSNLGCLGTLAFGNLTLEQIKQQSINALSLTDKPIAANLFARQNQNIPTLNKKSAVIKNLLPYYQQLEIDDSLLFDRQLTDLPDLNLQVEAILSTNIPIVTFTFGIPSSDIVKSLKQNGKIIIATATTIEEVKLIQNNEFDAVIIQGIEAGGHRASFLSDGSSGPTTLSLLNQSQQSLSIPIITTGGIMNGHHVAGHIKNGADACQLGTAYLFSNESKVESYYLEALLQRQTETCLSKCFTGKYGRVIKNKIIEQMEHQHVLPFPYQGQLTSSIRLKAIELGRYDYLPFWAGEAYSQGHRQSAEALTKKLIDELQF